MANKQPYTTERVSRSVLEKRLLANLRENKSQVAILCTRADCDLLLAALRAVPSGDLRKADAEDFAGGLEQLVRQAFA